MTTTALTRVKKELTNFLNDINVVPALLEPKPYMQPILCERIENYTVTQTRKNLKEEYRKKTKAVNMWKR